MNNQLAQQMTLILAAVALGSVAGTLPSAPWSDILEAPRVERVHIQEPIQIRSLPAPPRDTRVDAVFEHLLARQRRTGLSREELWELSEAVIETSDRYAFDPNLVLAVMHVESRFNAFAVSPKQALGLMQIIPSTGKWMAEKLGIPWHGPQTLFDPVTNVSIGVAYLRELWDRYEHLETALAAYNWGPTAIDRRLAQGGSLPSIYTGLVMDALQSGSS